MVMPASNGAGCAGKPASIELPADHPANPQAPESQFTPPQNIFKTDFAAKRGESEADSMMPHKMPPESYRQQPHMQHQMGPSTESDPDAAAKQKPAHNQGGKMHQEHSQ